MNRWPGRTGPRGSGSAPRVRACTKVRFDCVLAAAFESGDFERLVGLYAADALLDWSMPGRRARVVGPVAICRQLRAWWPGSGVFTRWDVSRFPSGLTIEFERRAGGPSSASGSSCRCATAGLFVIRRTAHGRTVASWRSCPTTRPWRRGG